MRSALIGYTGFVGSNLDRQHKFTHRYNTKNIDGIAGKRFDLVVCAGVTAANREPKADWDGIERLLTLLNEVTADRFILISTVEVYPRTEGVDEDFVIDPAGNHAYGRHRFLVEGFVRRTFPVRHIVRLPGLFGPGFKKNAIFDLLNDNGLETIDRDSTFQYYPIDRLWNDLLTVKTSDLELVNFATEPLAMSEIIGDFFAEKSGLVGKDSVGASHHDILTKYAGAFGREGRYMLDRSSVMDSLGQFIGGYRKGA